MPRPDPVLAAMLQEFDRAFAPAAVDVPEYSDGYGHRVAQNGILDAVRSAFGLALNAPRSGLPPAGRDR